MVQIRMTKSCCGAFEGMRDDIGARTAAWSATDAAHPLDDGGTKDYLGITDC